jgi:ribosomal protein S27E
VKKGEELDVRQLRPFRCPECDTKTFDVYHDGNGAVAVSCTGCGLLLVS